jgi:16S rRNA (guanine966-N2)-methyltransferase
MRINAGSARGRKLSRPPRSGVRPTTGRVRGVIFDILAAQKADLGRVLDLYSGTGALGVEALSRGADYCDFVDADRKACAVIRENLARTGWQERARVLGLPVARALGQLDGPYDVVVADPPYEYDRAELELRGLLEQGLLAPDGVLVVEHSKRRTWPEQLGDWRQVLSRRYGDTGVTVYRLAPGGAEA